MKKQVLYSCRCKVCGAQETYVLRSNNADNTLTDQDVYHVMSSYKSETHRFLYCQKCKLETKQEIISFDY